MAQFKAVNMCGLYIWGVKIFKSRITALFPFHTSECNIKLGEGNPRKPSGQRKRVGYKGLTYTCKSMTHFFCCAQRHWDEPCGCFSYCWTSNSGILWVWEGVAFAECVESLKKLEMTGRPLCDVLSGRILDEWSYPVQLLGNAFIKSSVWEAWVCPTSSTVRHSTGSESGVSRLHLTPEVWYIYLEIMGRMDLVS